MAELDYYSVMQKRIDYFAKKYDPYNRYSVKNEILPEKVTEEKQRKLRKKISAGYSHVISILF